MKYLLLFPLILLLCCSDSDAAIDAVIDTGAVVPTENKRDSVPENVPVWLRPEGVTTEARFLPNPGFEREERPLESWPAHVRGITLKPHGAKVHLYDGTEKYTQELHAAVLDVSVGKEDLQQCADAVMRLRADYLYLHERYDEINFNFVNGFAANYERWRAGERIWIKGNKTGWKDGDGPTPDRKAFDNYLHWVYMYANTASLEKQLLKRPLKDIEPGFVFILGGFPGHAIIVMDKAVNAATGDTEILLAQSYMPAQDIHILRNPARPDGNPWYSVEQIISEGALVTPEWNFGTDQLRRFP